MACRVPPGDVERVARHVGGHHRHARPIVRNADRDATAPVPISATSSGCAVDSGSRRSASSTMNSVSGRGMSTADVTRKFEPPELAHADDVGRRLALFAAGDPLREARLEAVGHQCAVAGDQRGRGPSRGWCGRTGPRRRRPRSEMPAPTSRSRAAVSASNSVTPEVVTGGSFSASWIRLAEPRRPRRPSASRRCRRRSPRRAVRRGRPRARRAAGAW